MRSDHTSGHARGACFALAALAAFTSAACDSSTPAGDDSHLEVVTRSLGADGGESAADGGALPAVIVAETRLATTGMTAWANFGSGVAVSGDIMAVGSPGATIDEELNVGAVYMFSRDPATRQWVEVAQLVPDAHVQSNDFGYQLALDGDTVAVAAPTRRAWNGVLAKEGGVYLFGRHAGGPDQWGALIRITDAVVAAGGMFAVSIALAGDLIFVGAVDAAADGMVLVFERNRGGDNAWGKIATILESDLGSAKGTDEAFGASLAVDGDNLLIGAPPDRNTDEEGDFFWNNNNGAAYLFSRDAVNRDQWTYITRLGSAAPEGVYDNFGLHLALAGDTAVVTAQDGTGPTEIQTGAVYVFRRDANVPGLWPQAAYLTPGDGQPNEAFGSAVALAGDTLLVGAPSKANGFNPAQGGAYVFRRRSAASDTWDPISVLTASDGQANDQFGSTVALDGETSVVGSPHREGDASPPNVHDFGGVYLYEPQIQAPPPPVQCQPAFAATDTLTDGGGVTSPAGVLLATAPGTVPAPLPVWILEAQPPVEPLHAGAVPLGLYYNIGAQCTTRAPVNTPFVVGLPVPLGADTSHLVVGVLVPGASILDITSSQRAWRQLPGVYDPARQLFLVTVAALHLEGYTFVLIEDPALESTQPAAAARVGAPRFIVQCGKDLEPLQCRANDKAGIEKLLVDAYEDYKLEGFPEPALLNAVPDLGPVTPGGGTTVTFQYPPVFWGITIEPRTDNILGACHEAAGHYHAGTKTLVLCGDPRQVEPAELKFNVRHELFHAVQHAYPNVPVDTASFDRWIIEGTATAAAAWNGTMNRVHELPEYPLRRVDTTFYDNTEWIAYQVQDFWVHLFTSTSPTPLGGRRALPLGELATFFDRGGTTADVEARLQNATPTYAPLAEEYWAWVKNQVVEHTDVTFAEAGAGPEHTFGDKPCEIEPRLVTAPGQAPTGFTYTSSRTKMDGAIAGFLQSTVMRVHFPVERANMTVTVEGDVGVTYKIYLDNDPADKAPKVEANCINEPSNMPKTFPRLERGANVYVLVANTSHDVGTGLNFTVSVVPGG